MAGLICLGPRDLLLLRKSNLLRIIKFGKAGRPSFRTRPGSEVGVFDFAKKQDFGLV